jgi:hypothetical protein
MKSFIKRIIVAAPAALYAWPALALDAQGGANAAHPASTPSDLNAQFTVISNILIYLTGAIAVIVLVFGGLRYVTSTGDAARVKSAKDTIMYGVIGVVVAIMAYAIVNFVTSNLK